MVFLLRQISVFVRGEGRGGGRCHQPSPVRHTRNILGPEYTDKIHACTEVSPCLFAVLSFRAFSFRDVSPQRNGELRSDEVLTQSTFFLVYRVTRASEWFQTRTVVRKSGTL